MLYIYYSTSLGLSANRPCNKNLTPQIQNANITGVRLPSASNTKYKVYYECKHGFRRIGKDHVTCKRSGQWGRVMIQCTPYRKCNTGLHICGAVYACLECLYMYVMCKKKESNVNNEHRQMQMCLPAPPPRAPMGSTGGF